MNNKEGYMQTYHLYSDGNYFPRAKKSGFGGYISSPEGEILVEYTEQIKEKDHAYSYELLGILRGLQIAQSKGIEHIVSHCDDKTTAKKLKEFFVDKIPTIPKNMKTELFNEVVELSKSFKTLKFEYIPRSENKYADALSRRYASLMEENFVKQYHSDLDFSQKKFEQEQKTNKRIFFSHSSIVRNPNKNNPFLVAPIRNKKVRRVSRDQQREDYEYLFFEAFNKDDQMILRAFNYDKDSNVKSIKEKIFPVEEQHFDNFCSFMCETLTHLKSTGAKNVWISSNYRNINSYFEQKEKMPSEQWENFLAVHKSLNGFNKVFFNHFPFDHKFSSEIAPVEKVKAKLDNDIEDLDTLLEQLSQGGFVKDQSKCFGAIIRHQLRNFKQKLERELDDIEISELIEETVATLSAKGYTNLPKPKMKR